MAQLAPVAPKSFYVNGLQGLRDALTAVAESTSGMITLINAVPDDFVGSWDLVGAGSISGEGTSVLGKATIQGISEIVEGDIEVGSTERGWKLDFDATPDVECIKAGDAVAIALIAGHDNSAIQGSDDDVLYIVDMATLTLETGILYNVPAFSVEIQYGTNK